MRHIMVDLETLGNTPYSVVPAIGAVIFSKDGPVDTFYQKLDVEQQMNAGLEVDASTLKWWFHQDTDSQKELFSRAVMPSTALKGFQRFCDPDNKEVFIWGNGASFDNVLLANIYEAFNMRCPWSFRNNRCYRTMKTLYSDVEYTSDREEPSHVAVEDAMWQVNHLIKILNEKDIPLK